MATRNLRTNQRKATKLTLLREAAAVRELAQNYLQATEAIRDSLAELYEKYAENGKLTHAEMTKYNRLQSLEKQLSEELRPAVLRSNRVIEKAVRVQYEESFYRHAWSIEQAAGVSLRWGLLSPDQVAAAVENDLRHLAKRRLSRETVQRVRTSITQGLIRGSTLRQMMGNVKEAISASANDAMRIVRTEAHRARELGGMRATQRSEEQGVKITRVWDATLDDRTRPGHAQLDGMPESQWRLGGIKPAYPGDPALPARQSINCRCTAVDEIEGYEPKVRRIRDEGLQPYETFGSWAERTGVRSNRYGQKYNFAG